MKLFFNLYYKNQSTAIISATSPEGRPMVSRIMTIVTKPADGISAAPMLATVETMLCLKKKTVVRIIVIVVYENLYLIAT